MRARHTRISRRDLLAGAGGLALVPLINGPAAALPDDMTAAIDEFTRGAAPKPGRVRLEIPELAENGNSVPLTVSVDSPMTEADHVRRIAVFSEHNPLPNVVRYRLGPRAGRADVSTYIRLAASQRIVAVAELSDGSFYSGQAVVVVTLAACIDGG